MAGLRRSLPLRIFGPFLWPPSDIEAGVLKLSTAVRGELKKNFLPFSLSRKSLSQIIPQRTGPRLVACNIRLICYNQS